MSAQLGGTPVLILKEGTSRNRGRDAQSSNILAAKVIAEAIKTSLGPRGMDKMLVDSLGDVTLTNDGATILKEIDVQHPAAKMIVEVAKTQDDEVGDGTTTAVIIAGELLRKAEELLDKDIHPITIVSGYKKAADESCKYIESIAIPIEPEDKDALKKVAMTSLNTKGVTGAREHFGQIAVDAVSAIAEKRGDKIRADIELINVIKKQGKSLFETELVNGMIIDKEVVHARMPKRIKNARIALLDAPLEIEKTEMDAEIRITDPSQMKAFLDEEEKMLKEMVDKVAATEANVVICQKGIDDLAQHYLAKAEIMAIRRAKKSDMEKLAKATGGKIVTNLDDLSADQLGEAGLVEEVRIGEDKLTYVRECKEPRAVTILIRGGTEHVVDEAERSMHDALCVTRDAIEDGKILAGGGAPQMEISKHLRGFAEAGGKEQLAIEAFADAMEVIPKTLAENGGYDQLDILVDLRAKHEKPVNKWFGVNVFTGKTADMLKENVIEPLRVTEQAIKSASEVAEMILKIDDVIASKATAGGMPGGPGGPGGGMPPGMGGMGGGEF
ncbi:MAG: thermosome subunit beta [Promethearchaeati archaeon SRVP18_Atabeyarchaeia-1]